MKKYVFIFFLLLSLNSFGQGFKSLVSKANDLAKSVQGSNINADEVSLGLKEALKIGAEKAANKLSKPDGFFKNSIYKILMPPEAQKIENTLRRIGLGQLADDFILSLNRAAENAVSASSPIFAKAITELTIQDAIRILRGKDTEATDYLMAKTSEELRKTFAPIVNNSLKNSKSLEYWEKIAKAYNAIPFGQKAIDPDLGAYVTQKCLDGIFMEVANEERNIRANPVARTTEILKKVFGN